ncbi:MAG: 5'/3'-nucleotidase SurE [Acidaminobacteraceae bacterium]
MNILITNDDGIYAHGLSSLVEHLAKDHKIYVVAPKSHQSAKSHSITLYEPLYVNEIDKFTHENIKTQTSVSGTPADCVKIAIGELLKDIDIDLVISGTNHGENLGHDVIYSGTVAAAIEASFHNIPAIACSLVGRRNYNFEPSAKFIANNVETLKSLITDPKVVLNINFPSSGNFKGCKLTELGSVSYYNVFDARKNPQGKTYYWVGGEPIENIEANHELTDVGAVVSDFISVTPIGFRFNSIKSIKNFDNKLKI